MEFKRTTGERREATRTLCAMLNDRGELVRFVSDAPIVAYGNPAAAADGAQPLLISAIGREMVAVTLPSIRRRQECPESVFRGRGP